MRRRDAVERAGHDSRATSPSSTRQHATERPHGRIDGIDVARAVAFGAMLLTHYASSDRPDDPRLLVELDSVANSWAGPLFCLILGIGAGLLASRGTDDRLFVKRGLGLFVLGVAVWPHTDSVLQILPHLGLLLAAVPLMRRIPERWLLPVAFFVFIIPSAITAVVDEHGLRLGTQPSAYTDLLRVHEVLGNLLWRGGYPLVGWVGFTLLGLWLARRPLDDRRTLWRLAMAGFLISITRPLFDAAFRALEGRPADRDAGGMAAFLDPSAHSNRTAWYVLACAAVVAVTATCLLLTRRPRRAAMPLVYLGQMALSAYVAHIVLLQIAVRDWRTESDPPLAFQFLLILVIFLGLAGLATAWRSRFRQGPLEALVRRVAG